VRALLRSPAAASDSVPLDLREVLSFENQKCLRLQNYWTYFIEPSGSLHFAPFFFSLTGMIADLKKRTHEIIKRLKKAYPDAHCALNHSNPFELLIATILSAQCTDVRVNIVTAALFRKYRVPEDFLNVSQKELENDIRSTGFYRNKARNIQAACKRIVEVYGGKVPEKMEDLLTLGGVARKTANVVMGNAFGIASGVVVDTHVSRLSQRLGLTKQKDPQKIEKDLIELVPKKHWVMFSHWLIFHGRRVCHARKPKCPDCVLNDICPARAAFWPNLPEAN
jgi:endonuclease-3